MTNPYRLTLKIEANGEESDFRLVRVENAEDLKGEPTEFGKNRTLSKS